MRVLAERAALREDAACLLGELGGTAREVGLSLSHSGTGASPRGQAALVSPATSTWS